MLAKNSSAMAEGALPSRINCPILANIMYESKPVLAMTVEKWTLNVKRMTYEFPQEVMVKQCHKSVFMGAELQL